MASRNLITDVAGLRVGHADDPRLASGCTAILFDKPAVGRGRRARRRARHPRDRPARCAPHGRRSRRGGAVRRLGLRARFRRPACRPGCASRAAASRSATSRADRVRARCCSTCSTAATRTGARFPPYRELGYAAAAAARPRTFALGTVGAGFGATTCQSQGRPRLGLGGDARRPHRRRAGGGQRLRQRHRRRRAGISGRRRSSSGASSAATAFPPTVPAEALVPHTKGRPGENTTIALVATDAVLDQGAGQQLAVMAQDGLSRAIYPVHTPLDGDIVFAAATGSAAAQDPVSEADRDSARRRQCARPRDRARGLRGDGAAVPGALPAWRDRFGTMG